MAYRAPELFDVKTGITLDEKVDIWVCDSPITNYLFSSYPDYTVARLHTLCARLLPFAVREHTNHRAGWLNSDGCHGSTVQAP